MTKYLVILSFLLLPSLTACTHRKQSLEQMSLRQLNGTCLTTVKAAENDNKQLVAINAEISSDLLEIEKNLAQTKERQKECRKAAIKHGLGK